MTINEKLKAPIDKLRYMSIWSGGDIPYDGSISDNKIKEWWKLYGKQVKE
jgi:hypothetical protein